MMAFHTTINKKKTFSEEKKRKSQMGLFHMKKVFKISHRLVVTEKNKIRWSGNTEFKHYSPTQCQISKLPT